MKKFSSLLILCAILSSASFYFFFNPNFTKLKKESATFSNKIAIPNQDKKSEKEQNNFSVAQQNQNKKSDSKKNTLLKTRKIKNEKTERDENEKRDIENGEADEMPVSQKIEEVFELERERTKNPVTGEVPLDGLVKAIQNTRTQQDFFEKQHTFFRTLISNAKWQERGPSNVGGRTRAILVEANDPTKKTVFAGGSTGGIFKNTNIIDANSKWTRVNDWMSNLSISSFAQDPTNPKILYAGSGDCDGRDAQGAGIFKSVDGGNNWAQLPSTNNATFQTNASIVVLPDSGQILVGTFKGLYKSRDGGNTWDKVLGSGLDFGGVLNSFYRIVRASDGSIYACNDNTVFRSKGKGDLNTWENISAANGFSKNWLRTEIAVAPSNPNVVYAVGNVKNLGSVVYATTDGGTTWTSGTQPVWIDGCGGAGSAVDFTRTQAWYDLTLAVSPTDPNMIFLGGVDQFKSPDGGKSWKQLSYWPNCGNANRPYIHADHHAAMFESNTTDVLYIGTDGGVFRIENASASNYTVLERTNNYVTTQFYGGAIHPGAGVSQFLAGAQDNGTQSVKNGGIGVAQQVIGGDGFLSFIDQLDGNYQLGSLYNGAWYLSRDGGKTFTTAAKSNADFLCPADYDPKKKILYAQSSASDLWIWDVSLKVPKAIALDIPNLTINNGTTNNIAFIKVDNYTDNRIYLGLKNGQIHQVDNANDATNITSKQIAFFTGVISGIDIDRNNTQHLLVTVSSYGVPHIFETKNGGIRWTNLTSNLPDMPVRAVLFSPNNDNKALLATDLGVWFTENLDSTNTIWFPPVAGKGTPLVRTSTLKIRESDKTVLAATYGRGLFTSNIFSAPSAVSEFFPISYINVPTQFYAGSSGGADTYNWNFGDGITDTSETALHSYTQVGIYDVSLNINKDAKYTSSKKIKILPKVPTPYAPTAANYTGDLESTEVPFGAYSATGSLFERGKSTVIGKEGTHSGNYAYVLGLKEQAYQKNTEAYLYLPLYDMTKSGIYTFSFWALYDIQKGYDGFRVQYSLDKGNTWRTLGSKSDNNWYDFQNAGVAGAFNTGDSYFSNTLDVWTKFKIDVSFLANNPDVALRFQFLASDFLPSTGVAIDDVQLSRYEGASRTVFTAQSGNFTASQTSIDFSFATQPEYYVNYYDIEVSNNGKTFEKKITKIKPLSGVSAELQNYTARWDGTPLDVYYARIVAYGADAKSNYLDTVYSPIFVVKRLKDAVQSATTIFPNPFTSTLSVTFNDVINTPVLFQLYNDAGQLMYERTDTPNNVFYDIPGSNFGAGIYFLSVTIGTNKRQTFKVVSSN